MAINDPFAALESQPNLQSLIISEVVNPLPGNSLFELNLTDFEKGLLIGFILIYLIQEI